MNQLQSVDSEPITTLISEKYQTVVPAKVRRMLNMGAGDTILWRLIRSGDQIKVIAEPKPKNVASALRGLGKHIWKNVDIDTYIKNLREEWDNR